MIQKKTFHITSWRQWDHEINASVKEFRMHYTISPNMILCNRTTLSRMDIAADKQKIRDCSGNPVGKSQYCSIDAFIGDDYELRFCVDEKLADKCFVLIFDSDPDDDGGEPIPDEDTDTVDYKATGTA